jgi:hypothetical protein
MGTAIIRRVKLWVKLGEVVAAAAQTGNGHQ